MTPMPARRSVVEFVYPKLPATHRRFWLVVDPESGVDLCKIDPGFVGPATVTYTIADSFGSVSTVATLTVTVSDGRLTVDAIGGTNTKLESYSLILLS